jgi:hypothetical protein
MRRLQRACLSPTATPKPTQSVQPTRTGSAQISQAVTSTDVKTTSTTTSSSSSAQPSSTEQPVPYYFASKWGTPVEKFKNFIQELDGGAGRAEIDDYGQICRTNLTSSAADGLKAKYPFLPLAFADVCLPSDLDFKKEEYHAIPNPRMESDLSLRVKAQPKYSQIETMAGSPSLMPRMLLPEERDAPYWKKMISSPFQEPLQRDPTQDPSYVRDDTQGRGTTIYILDDGFDLSYKVSLPRSFI